MAPKGLPEPTPTTLGDLLYADRTGASVSEEDWVALLRSIAAGDQEALRSLYARAHRLVFTLAVRICEQREIAEEITIDVFHEVWRRAGQYHPDGGSVLGWIMNQARSRAIDRVRYERRKKRVPPEGGVDAGVSPIEPPELVDARRRRRDLERALSVLTEDERVTIETAFFSDLTYPETAALLGQPLGTVKTRIRSALAKLRSALERGEP